MLDYLWSMHFPHERLRKFFAGEFLSLGVLSAFGWGVMSAHRFWAAEIFFSLAFFATSLQLVFRISSIKKPSRKITSGVLLLVGVWWGELYVTGIVKEQADEYYTALIEKLARVPESLAAKCHIKGTIESFALARVYSEAPRKNLYSRSGLPEKHDMKILSQELFYQWNISLKPNHPGVKVVIEIANIMPSDRIRIVPEESAIYQWTPKWFSGFIEPQRKRPDYYVRVITLSEIPLNQEASITVRRQMLKRAPFPDEILQVKRIDSSNCDVDVPKNSDGQSESVKIAKQREILTAQRYNGGGRAPIARDPGDAKLGKLQAAFELKCADNLCSGKTVQEISAWSGFGRLPPLPESPKTYPPPASPGTAVLVQPGGKWNSNCDTVYAPNGPGVENRGEITSNKLSINTPSGCSEQEKMSQEIDSLLGLINNNHLDEARWTLVVRDEVKRNLGPKVASDFESQSSLEKKKEFLIKLKASLSSH